MQEISPYNRKKLMELAAFLIELAERFKNEEPKEGAA